MKGFSKNLGIAALTAAITAPAAIVIDRQFDDRAQEHAVETVDIAKDQSQAAMRDVLEVPEREVITELKMESVKVIRPFENSDIDITKILKIEVLPPEEN